MQIRSGLNVTSIPSHYSSSRRSPQNKSKTYKKRKQGSDFPSRSHRNTHSSKTGKRSTKNQAHRHSSNRLLKEIDRALEGSAERRGDKSSRLRQQKNYGQSRHGKHRVLKELEPKNYLYQSLMGKKTIHKNESAMKGASFRAVRKPDDEILTRAQAEAVMDRFRQLFHNFEVKWLHYLLLNMIAC